MNFDGAEFFRIDACLVCCEIHYHLMKDDMVVPCQRVFPHTSDVQSSMKQIPIPQNKLVISVQYLPLQTCSIFSA